MKKPEVAKSKKESYMSEQDWNLGFQSQQWGINLFSNWVKLGCVMDDLKVSGENKSEMQN